MISPVQYSLVANKNIVTCNRRRHTGRCSPICEYMASYDNKLTAKKCNFADQY